MKTLCLVLRKWSSYRGHPRNQLQVSSNIRVHQRQPLKRGSTKSTMSSTDQIYVSMSSRLAPSSSNMDQSTQKGGLPVSHSKCTTHRTSSPCRRTERLRFWHRTSRSVARKLSPSGPFWAIQVLQKGLQLLEVLLPHTE